MYFFARIWSTCDLFNNILKYIIIMKYVKIFDLLQQY
jgi:hypothetical protein